jgi:diketogulonate reductase-like aldo/keto reductase
LKSTKLAQFAKRHGMTAAQAALAWLLAKQDVIVIPKTSQRERLRENIAALDIALSEKQLRELDGAFAPPKEPRPLEML